MFYMTITLFRNPNSPLAVPTQWPAYDRDEKLYLEISTEPQVRNETQEMRDIVHFWHHDFVNVVLPPANGEENMRNAHSYMYCKCRCNSAQSLTHSLKPQCG